MAFTESIFMQGAISQLILTYEVKTYCTLTVKSSIRFKVVSFLLVLFQAEGTPWRCTATLEITQGKKDEQVGLQNYK